MEGNHFLLACTVQSCGVVIRTHSNSTHTNAITSHDNIYSTTFQQNKHIPRNEKKIARHIRFTSGSGDVFELYYVSCFWHKTECCAPCMVGAGWVLCTRWMGMCGQHSSRKCWKVLSLKGCHVLEKWNGIHISIFYYRTEWERTSGDRMKIENVEEDWVSDSHNQEIDNRTRQSHWS